MFKAWKKEKDLRLRSTSRQRKQKEEHENAQKKQEEEKKKDAEKMFQAWYCRNIPTKLVYTFLIVPGQKKKTRKSNTLLTDSENFP